ncbi:MAG: hypothetical protein HYY50_01190 [Candidatus Kerfeldbacteria bacterium]|nr:hypothetical protein [Candidatus Kerfeldbacteria bacterium]
MADTDEPTTEHETSQEKCPTRLRGRAQSLTERAAAGDAVVWNSALRRSLAFREYYEFQGADCDDRVFIMR